jgi:hypothetical protein
MKLVLKVLTPNRKLLFRGREVRSPVTMVGEEAEIQRMTIELKKLGSIKFSVESYSEDQQPKFITEQKIKDPIIEKINEPLSTLERLLKSKE